MLRINFSGGGFLRLDCSFGESLVWHWLWLLYICYELRFLCSNYLIAWSHRVAYEYE